MDIIVVPFAWLLRVFYSFTGNYGLALVLFAVVVKLIMLPFQMKGKRGTMRMTRLQPRMKELEKKYEGNKQKYQEEVAKLHREEGVNPMSGCVWSLIPFPIMIALYSVIRQPLSKLMQLTAEQITAVTDKLVQMGAYTIPEKTSAYYEIEIADLVHQNYEAVRAVVPGIMDIDFSFLGLNLGRTPSWRVWEFDWTNTELLLPALGLFLIPLISTGLQYLQMKIGNRTMPQGDQQGSMKTMLMIMPLMSLWIGFSFPAGLSIYWLVGNVLAIFQDLWLNKRYTAIMDAEDAERNERYRLREEELERKRLETERLRAQGELTRNENTSKKKLQAEKRTKQELRAAAEKASQKKDLAEAEIPESQVGKRRYARGRAYVEDRFQNPEGAQERTRLASEASEADETAEADMALIAGTDGETDAAALYEADSGGADGDETGSGADDACEAEGDGEDDSYEAEDDGEDAEQED